MLVFVYVVSGYVYVGVDEVVWKKQLVTFLYEYYVTTHGNNTTTANILNYNLTRCFNFFAEVLFRGQLRSNSLW